MVVDLKRQVTGPPTELADAQLSAALTDGIAFNECGGAICRL
jgi:hypothetical protein